MKLKKVVKFCLGVAAIYIAMSAGFVEFISQMEIIVMILAAVILGGWLACEEAEERKELLSDISERLKKDGII